MRNADGGKNVAWNEELGPIQNVSSDQTLKLEVGTVRPGLQGPAGEAA